jgi:glycosyltransferase involved in cell wall biosynthesis
MIMIRDHHFVSVIIPTIGRTTLDLCKAALAKQKRPSDEVIVILDHERRGIAWGRNKGIKQAQGDLIAFTDDDCIPPEDWLERLIEAIDKHDAAGAGGTFRETDPLLQDIRERRQFSDVEQVDTFGLVGNGGNIMYHREWLDLCAAHDGYVFNESFKSSEDWELAWRLRIRGAKLIYVPNPVTHLRRITPWQFLRHQFNRGIGIAYLYLIQRPARTDIPPAQSLLWGQDGVKTQAKWFRAFWYKAIGPFDITSFKHIKHFCLFWLGEKFQGAGFLWGLGYQYYSRKIRHCESLIHPQVQLK